MANSALESLSFRTRLAGFFTVLVVIAILARLIDLQLLSPTVDAEVSEKKATREMPWKPRRGLILDRNHRELVRNEERVHLRVEVQLVPDRFALAKAIAPVLLREASMDYDAILKVLTMDSRDLEPKKYREVFLLNNLSPTLVETLREFQPEGVAKQGSRYVPEKPNEVWRFRTPISGLVLVGVPTRNYLKKELAAQVIGFVNTENVGSMGIEKFEDEQLLAEPVKIQGIRYGDWRTIIQKDYTRGVPHRGADVVLTLDETIQWMTERALYEQCEKYLARVGVAIVMDPFNGDILAMANYPAFEADRKGAYGSVEENNLRGSNHAITALFEPGSTFKPFIVAAGLDLGVITEESQFDLEGGRRYVRGRSKPITDVHPVRGYADVGKILIYSSNIGVGKIAEEIVGRESLQDRPVLHNYLKAFGFGSRTGVTLPGETSMYFNPRDPMKWSRLDILPLAFGAGPVMVSPIGLASAYCILANGGIRVPPRIIDGIAGSLDGKYYPNPIPSGERVIKQEAADSVRGLLRKVVEHENSKAKSEWYNVGGKTGTALKLVNGAYSEQHRLLSFAGIAPVDDPKLVAVVMIDEAKRQDPNDKRRLFGNEVAAPVFKRIVEDVLAYMNVPPDCVPEAFPTPTPKPTATPILPDPSADSDPAEPLAERIEASPISGPAETGNGFLSALEQVVRSLGAADAPGSDSDRLAEGGRER